jgi:predicted metal-dependent enzyme (double-stranded beta helix superfamily)
MAENFDRFRRFLCDMTILCDTGADETEIRVEGGRLLRDLVAHDDWLPAEFCAPDPASYQQYLLYCDPRERFSVVSFVWGPGQRTPVHDHTVWGLIGMLRGSEIARNYAIEPEARPGGRLVVTGTEVLVPGGVTAVSPTIGDIHRVENALADRPSISIHVYGGNIGAIARHVFVPETGEAKPFVSGYSNRLLPNLWDRSAAIRARLAA